MPPPPTLRPSRKSDLLVVGGGPAGLATAIFGALGGLRATVVEQRVFPVDKACGEGLMPGGVSLLERMGVRLEASHPLEGIRYVDGEHGVEARFRSGHGLGVRRVELSRALVNRARELGVEIVEGARVLRTETTSGGARVVSDRGELESEWLVAADGLKSPLRKAAGLDGQPRLRRAERFGVRRHFHLSPWSPFVEVHWARGVEAYVTPVGERELGVALLWRGRPESFEALFARFPRLARRVAGAEVASATAGAGPLRQLARRVTRGRLALVGDAAGYVDALTGEGVGLGFRSAEALARSILGGGLESYEREYWRLSRRYRLMTELVLGLVALPRLRRALIRGLALRPSLFGRLLQFHHPVNVIK